MPVGASRGCGSPGIGGWRTGPYPPLLRLRHEDLGGCARPHSARAVDARSEARLTFRAARFAAVSIAAARRAAARSLVSTLPRKRPTCVSESVALQAFDYYPDNIDLLIL